MDGRQTFPYRIMEGLSVIRSQSVASANGASNFYVPDLRLEAIVAPLLFRHVGVLKALAILFSKEAG
jgi:hypothetical protein